MVKYCITKYPMGSLPNQESAGRYMDGYLYENLKILAKKIVNDMTFLAFISSSTLEVGTGKSVMAQQIAECWTELVNEMHGQKLEFTADNLVFKPEKLIEVSFKVPRFSCVILDEWEDAHYWSKLGMTLRKFMRKCRQLNLFMICICPNFFQIPRSFATGRSVFFIDVRFEGEFERGYFRFYNFERKRELYNKGKKTEDYTVVTCNFYGRFLDGYGIPEKEYREAKRKDLDDYDEDNKNELDPKLFTIQIARKIRLKLPKVTQKEWAEAFGVSLRSISRWFTDKKYKKDEGVPLEDDTAPE